MHAYIAITDRDWYELLSARREIEEVNFWQPGGQRLFQAIALNELFLFKLHSPNNCIVGGGFLAHTTLLPVSLAWETFGEKNGVRSLAEMRRRIEKYRHGTRDSRADYKIGCILLNKPFFFSRENWIETPPDFKKNIVQGKTYDLSVEPGLSLWSVVQERLTQRAYGNGTVEDKQQRYGNALEIFPRLGQGTFRICVTDAYVRRCSITEEKTLPVLEAAHIKPYTDGGAHVVQNGLLLRSDLHTLYDRGYLAITPDYHVEVSRRIKEEYENGREYYALQGRELHLPPDCSKWPDPALLAWHNDRFAA